MESPTIDRWEQLVARLRQVAARHLTGEGCGEIDVTLQFSHGALVGWRRPEYHSWEPEAASAEVLEVRARRREKLE